MKIKKGFSEKLFESAVVLIMTLILFVTLYPFWYVAVYSFNEGADAARGGFYFWPRVFSLTNYRAVFQNTALLQAFLVTTARTLIGAAVPALFTGLAAFAMSHQHLLLRKAYMAIGTITMFFGAGIIPYYMLIRDLGLRNSFWVYIIPTLFSFYNMIIMMTFFRQLPEGLEEAAKIEGAGYWQVFFYITVPLSGPIFATMALFNGVYHWNDYFTAILFIDKQELMPIQTILYRIVAESAGQNMLTAVNIPEEAQKRRLTSESLKMATMMVTTLPIICVYPFLQKYFVKGMLIGSIKG